KFPQSKNTIGFSLSLSNSIILSVKISQPIPLWLAAAPPLTDKTVFNKSTPFFAHGVKSPLFGIG
ncbi:hypothetical protein RFZ45_11515, partial [Acinetobacter baumannii]|nr:hypothetical protein [Acinetobacter baumannii]